MSTNVIHLESFEAPSVQVASDVKELRSIISRLYEHMLNPERKKLLVAEFGDLYGAAGVLRNILIELDESEAA